MKRLISFLMFCVASGLSAQTSTFSSAPQSPTVWSNGTTYIIGQPVQMGTTPACYTYQSLQNGNVGNTPPAFGAGATAFWTAAMADCPGGASSTIQTVNQSLFTTWYDFVMSGNCTDTIGGNTCTPATGGPAPTFTASGVQSGTGYTSISLPLAAWGAAAKTVIVAYRNNFSGNLARTGQCGYLFSIDSGYSYGPNCAQQMTGPSVTQGGINQLRSLDRAPNDVCSALAIDGAANGVIYVNGVSSAVYPKINTVPSTLTPSSTSYLFNYLTNTNYYWLGTIQSVLISQSTLTAAQIQQTCAALQYRYASRNINYADTTDYSRNTYVAWGDSIPDGQYLSWINGSSIDQNALTLTGFDPVYYPATQGGMSAAVAAPLYNSWVAPLLTRSSGPIKVLKANWFSNDVIASQTNAQIITNLTTIATAAHAQKTIVINGTALPRTTYTTAQNTQRTQFNTLLISDTLAGTAVGDITADYAAEPSMGNLNNNSNTLFYLNVSPIGTHPTVLGAQLLAPPLATAMNRAFTPYKPNCQSIPVTYLAFTGNAATTQTIPLYQLYSGEVITSISAQVVTSSPFTTAGVTTGVFSGSGITAATLSIGDTNGTATQYTANQNLLAASNAVPVVPYYQSVNGDVYATVTTTGGNTSALTAGAINISVCSQRIR